MRVTAMCILSAVCLVATVPPATAQPTDHPFALVNVIDLFDLFFLDPNQQNSTFDPFTGPPPNWAAYQANPRIGTNPSAVAVSGDRLWIGGFWNGGNYEGGTAAARQSWYASVGVGEVPNIYFTSGFGGTIKYVPTINVGPTIYTTESITGMDYDPVLKRLYVAYDDPYDFYCVPPFCFLPPGTTSQEPSYIAAIDADPNSPTYKQFIWKRGDPFYPIVNPDIDTGDRFYGGVAVDPLEPTRLWISMIGDPRNATSTWGFRALNVLNPAAAALRLNVKNTDPTTAECFATFFRQIGFDEVSGDMFVRNANALEWIERDPRGSVGPFKPYVLFIEEPETGGNGTANTAASGDDVQLIPVGNAVTAGQNIIGAGGNGVIDTTPAGDDVKSRLEIVNARPIGNKDVPGDDGACNDDPINGFPNGPFGQGQGLAAISASNLPDLSEDIVVGNNRPTFGANKPKDIKFFTLGGQLVGELEVPCSPVPTGSTGIAIYDMDYDASTGTLVVVEFEQRKAFVYRAQTDNGPRVSRYDFTRNGFTDLADFAGLQACFTGPSPTGVLSLNCQRMNSDSDCDIDLLDWFEFYAVWEADFGS